MSCVIVGRGPQIDADGGTGVIAPRAIRQRDGVVAGDANARGGDAQRFEQRRPCQRLPQSDEIGTRQYHGRPPAECAIVHRPQTLARQSSDRAGVNGQIQRIEHGPGVAAEGFMIAPSGAKLPRNTASEPSA